MPMPMPNRRTLLIASLTAAAGLGGRLTAARAQSAEQSSAFIAQAGKDLIAVINAPGPSAGKQAELQQIVDRIVDVDEVARFCLGRFWRTAAPDQQQKYLALFHQVLLKNITGKLGEYQGVTFAVSRTVPRDNGVSVITIVTRPGSAPANVEWVVNAATGSPRIIDVVAEGTSLRLTQRSDYASYLARNGNSLPALLDAMRQQLTQSG